MTLDTIARGLVAGAAGTAVMTLSEKIEQAITRRPNSYVPAHTLERLLGLPTKPDSERLVLNHLMHWGQGVLVGTIRALMARRGFRGARASLVFTGIRFGVDQTLENATGVGAPPWTWPRDERRIDIFHKAVYGLATGLVADRLVASGR